jgi:hypothetical protein
MFLAALILCRSILLEVPSLLQTKAPLRFGVLMAVDMEVTAF